MHIAALAAALKVPVSKLEALEADNHAALPDAVFVRALAASVCRTLKVDPAAILALLPQSQGPRLSMDSAGLNAPVKGSVGKSTVSSASFSNSRSTSRSVAFVVLALLVGAVFLFFFPRQQEGGGSAVISAPVPTTLPSVAAAETSTVAEHPLESAPAPSSHVLAAAPTTAAASAASAPGAVASAPSAAEAPVGALVLRARGESWVQVRDSTGAVALQRNLAAGESVSVAAPTPLTVVIGRADATEVIVRGKPFDLTAVSRENVARFEVK